MFALIIGGKTVDTILAWDRNDAAVYASRRYPGATVTVVRV
jgi:hypothetical protein